jgi:hypothetical protein
VMTKRPCFPGVSASLAFEECFTMRRIEVAA